MDKLYTAPRQFIELIQAFALVYSLDLDADRSYLRLKKDLGRKAAPPPPRILVIEKLSQNLIRIACYEQDEREPPKLALVFATELVDGEETWNPVSITQGDLTRQVATTDEVGFVCKFDSLGTKEAASLCRAWTYELEQQQWHLNGKPVPGISATLRYFSLLEILEPPKLPNENPWISLSDYHIQGNIQGLLALVDAAMSALAFQSEGIAQIFEADDSHDLKVTLYQPPGA